MMTNFTPAEIDAWCIKFWTQKQPLRKRASEVFSRKWAVRGKTKEEFYQKWIFSQFHLIVTLNEQLLRISLRIIWPVVKFLTFSAPSNKLGPSSINLMCILSKRTDKSLKQESFKSAWDKSLPTELGKTSAQLNQSIEQQKLQSFLTWRINSH